MGKLATSSGKPGSPPALGLSVLAAREQRDETRGALSRGRGVHGSCPCGLGRLPSERRRLLEECAREPQGSSPPQSQPLSHPQIFVKGLPCDREGARAGREREGTLADEAPGPRGVRRGRRRPSGFNFKGKGAEGECFAEEDASYSFAVRKGNSSHSVPVPM